MADQLRERILRGARQEIARLQLGLVLYADTQDGRPVVAADERGVARGVEVTIFRCPRVLEFHHRVTRKDGDKEWRRYRSKRSRIAGRSWPERLGREAVAEILADLRDKGLVLDGPPWLREDVE